MYDLDIKITDLVWQSDWKGDEVGWPEVDIVGCYQKQTPTKTILMYIDLEHGELLDAWILEEC